MSVLEAQRPQPFVLPFPKLAYGIGILLTIFIALITGVNWQAGLTLTLAFGYMVLVSIRLEWGVYIIVAFAVLCIDGWAPNRSPEEVVFRLAVGHMYIMEFAVYGLLAAYFMRRAFGKAGGNGDKIFAASPVEKPLKAFTFLLPVFAAYGWFRGYPAQEAFGYYEWRSLFLAIVFFFLICTIFDSSAKALRLFEWFIVWCTLAAFYSVMIFIFGAPPGTADFLGVGPVGEGPQNYMFMFAAVSAIAVLIYCDRLTIPKYRLFLVAAILCTLNILISQKRDPQLGLIVGLIVITWKIPIRKKIRWAVLASTAGLAAALIIAAVGIRVGGGDISQSAARYGEVVDFVQNPRTLLKPEGSLAFHILDCFDAWNTIKQHPVLGSGFGSEYHREYTLLSGVGGEGAGLETGMVHNQYLTIWWKMGIAGLGVCFWLIFEICRYGRRKLFKTNLIFTDAVALGLFAAFCGDLAVEMWGSSWTTDTKFPIILFLSLALMMQLTRASHRSVRSA